MWNEIVVIKSWLTFFHRYLFSPYKNLTVLQEICSRSFLNDKNILRTIEKYSSLPYPVLGKINETIVWYNAFDVYVGSHIIRYLAECLRYFGLKFSVFWKGNE